MQLPRYQKDRKQLIHPIAEVRVAAMIPSCHQEGLLLELSRMARVAAAMTMATSQQDVVAPKRQFGSF